jgi:hypothetical protein
MDVTPSRGDQFADSESRIHRHIDDRGVRLVNQFDQRCKLLRPDERLVSAGATLRRSQTQALSRILY